MCNNKKKVTPCFVSFCHGKANLNIFKVKFAMAIKKKKKSHIQGQWGRICWYLKDQDYQEGFNLDSKSERHNFMCCTKSEIGRQIRIFLMSYNTQ